MKATHLTISERERLAYITGDTMTASMLADIDDLDRECETLAEERDNAQEDSLTLWDNKNGPAEAYKVFFFDCFERLAGHYPCPSVTSDYDKSVIFEAIEKGEAYAG